MNKRILYVLGMSVFLFSYACKPKERARRSSLEGKKTEYLLEQIERNTFHFETFSSKVDIELEQADKKISFRGNLRIQRDSAIWISITPALGIEVARVLITQDTVKVLNRLNKEYFIGDYSYINQRFNIDLEFELLQALLLGNTIDFEPDEKLKFSIDKEKYYLGNLTKRKAKKADDKPKKIEKEKEAVISLWINQNNFKVEDFLYSDLTAGHFITGTYQNHFSVDDQLLPKDLKFEFQSKDPKLVSLEYSRVSLNQSIKFSFNISSKYEQVFY